MPSIIEKLIRTVCNYSTTDVASVQCLSQVGMYFKVLKVV